MEEVVAETISSTRTSNSKLKTQNSAPQKGTTPVSSIWGDIDVEEIAEDPFYVAPGTYAAVCTEAKIQAKDGKTGLVIVWIIDEPDSSAHNSQVREYFRLFPGRQFKDLDAKEQKSLSFFMLRLRRGFDLTKEEIKALEPDNLIGAKAFITTVNTDSTDDNGKTTTYVNVRDALCERIMKEERGDIGTDNSTNDFDL